MPSTGFMWTILKSCSHAARSESGLISQTRTWGSCVYSRGWRGRSLPRQAHGDPVCTVEAGVAGSGQLQGECPSRGMLMIAPRIFGQQRVQRELLEKGPD